MYALHLPPLIGIPQIIPRRQAHFGKNGPRRRLEFSGQPQIVDVGDSYEQLFALFRRHAPPTTPSVGCADTPPRCIRMSFRQRPSSCPMALPSNSYAIWSCSPYSWKGTEQVLFTSFIRPYSCTPFTALGNSTPSCLAVTLLDESITVNSKILRSCNPRYPLDEPLAVPPVCLAFE